LKFTLEGKDIKIPKGTVYITYGIADPPVEDDDTSTISSDSEYSKELFTIVTISSIQVYTNHDCNNISLKIYIYIINIHEN
jgi:hypothetical protein